jgi:hypothetical protein
MRSCLILLLAGALAITSPAQAASPQSKRVETFHQRGMFFDVLFGENPCTGVPFEQGGLDINGTVTVHLTEIERPLETILHYTEVTAGEASGTDINGVTYAGRFTNHAASGFSSRRLVETTTFMLKLAGSDGTTISTRLTHHATINGLTGSVIVSFDDPRLTCG